MKILCLFLRYGEGEYPEAFQGLRRWYDSNIRNARPAFWVIDNKLLAGYDTANADGFRVLGGDNRFWEFSAWDSILKTFAGQAGQFDIVHFVTSAYNTLYTGYLDHFSELQLDYVLNRPVCLGHIDSYDEPVEIRGYTSRHWIRTCFFFLSRRSLTRLGSILSLENRAEFFDEKGQLRQGPISSFYIKCITGWLGGRVLQGVSWHSTLTDSEHFQQKAMAILNEHMLAVRMRECGLNPVDFCWLRHALATGSGNSLPEPAPWEQQIELRRQVLSGEIGMDRIA
ncbi:MAG: hypothetical protein JW793_10065 [Acidobacteria bacterium]|nr:hypothetical protein [Acidobacteriota bacterium]